MSKVKHSEIKFRTVTFFERELILTPEELSYMRPRHGGGVGKCPTISTPSHVKTQKFVEKEYTTASLGNITVCAENAYKARVLLAERLYAMSAPVR